MSNAKIPENGKIYFGGTVITMDEAKPSAEAVFIKDGLIISVGTTSELEKNWPDAEKTDLAGHVIMPSFIDGHSHMANEGLFTMKCDLIGCRSFDEILERIITYRKNNNYTHGEILQCRGYDQTILKEKSHPTSLILDSLDIDNPVICVHQSGHMLTANTAMMKLCGVGDSVKTPDGGFIGRDENGHLSGYFEEKATSLIRSKIPEYTEKQVENAILSAQEEYFSYGITTIQDGSGIDANMLAIYRRLADEGRLKADVVAYIGAKDKEDFWRRVTREYGNRKYSNHFKVGGIKIVLDGSPQARTAWMKEPYEGESEYRGYPCFSDDFVNQTVLSATKCDLQVLAHCNGDAAAQQFVTAVETAALKNPKALGLRHEVIHTQTTDDKTLDRMAKLKMIASVFVGHCWFWGDTHLKNFGNIRGNRISPARQCITRKIPYNFHQDSPVTKPDMLHSIWCAVNRITKSGVQIGPEYKLTAMEALWGTTCGGAYSYFEENSKGKLKEGFVADMVILDRNPLTVDPLEIKDIKVLETIKDGKTVYRKEK